MIRPDGSIRWVRDRAFPVKNAAGQFYRVVGHCRRLHRPKARGRGLERSRPAQGRVPGDVGPRTAQSAGSDPQRRCESAAAAARCDADRSRPGSMMERQVQQLVRLVDDLLDISRITRGKIATSQGAGRTGGGGRECRRGGPPAHRGTGARADRHAAAGTGRIWTPTRSGWPRCSPTCSTNAAKYTDKGGHIWLTAERQGGESVVSVRDTGIGIAAEHLPHSSRCSRRWHRRWSARKAAWASAWRWCEVWSRCTAAASRPAAMAPARAASSSCVCRLPRTAPLPAQVERRRPGSRSRGQCRILVVDDNRDAADSLAMMLRLMGHEIRDRLRRTRSGPGGGDLPSRRGAARHRPAEDERLRGGTPHPGAAVGQGPGPHRLDRLGPGRGQTPWRSRPASTIT